MIAVVGLAAYLIFEILRPSVLLNTQTPGPVMLVVAVLTSLAWLVQTAANPTGWRQTPATRFLLIMVGWGILSAAFHFEGASITVEKIFDLMKIAMVYLIAFQSTSTEGRVQFLKRLLIALILYLSLGAILHVQGYTVPGFSGDRQNRVQYAEIFSDSNDLGQLFSTAFAMLFFRLFNGSSGPMKPVLFGGLVLTGWAVFLTESRGAMLGLLLGVFLALRQRIGVVIPAVLGLTMLVAMNRLGVARMDRLSTGESSAEGRLKAWGQGWYMLRSNPLLGVGPRNFTEHHATTAHSSLVQLTAEMGFPALICWIGFYYFPLVGMVRSVMPEQLRVMLNIGRPPPPPPVLVQQLQVGVAVYLLTSLFLSRAYQLIPYVLVGLLMSSMTLQKETAPVREILRKPVIGPAGRRPEPMPAPVRVSLAPREDVVHVDYRLLVLLAFGAVLVWRVMARHFIVGP